MTHISTAGLVMQGTYWSTTPDGYGGYTFASPVLVKCRWEDKSEVFMSPLLGREEVSRARVFVDRDMSVGDWIALGDYTATPDPTVISKALAIRAFKRITDLRNVQVSRLAIL